ncbi:MAG: hypothetical protein JWN52_4680 [Actinomycetia bacterium]|nr:hypothetical protein [Actinomycetes bacterium]
MVQPDQGIANAALLRPLPRLITDRQQVPACTYEDSTALGGILHEYATRVGQGDVACRHVAARGYTRIDWQATGIAREVFWRDLSELCCLMSNYGIPAGKELPCLLRRAGAGQDLDLLQEILLELRDDYAGAQDELARR